MAAPNELSFLPDDYLERKTRQRTNAICAVLFCITLGAIASAFWVTERSMRQIDQQAAIVDQQYTDAAKRIEQFQELQERQRTMVHQAELSGSLLEKVQRSSILAQLTNGMPPGVSLLDFDLDAKIIANPTGTVAPKTAFDVRKAEVDAANGANATSARPRVYDVTFRATGVAENDGEVAQFITKLNKCALNNVTLFNDVNLLFTDEFQPGQKTGEKLRKFQIEMTLNPNAKTEPDAGQQQTASTSLEAK